MSTKQVTNNPTLICYPIVRNRPKRPFGTRPVACQFRRGRIFVHDDRRPEGLRWTGQARRGRFEKMAPRTAAETNRRKGVVPAGNATGEGQPIVLR